MDESKFFEEAERWDVFLGRRSRSTRSFCRRYPGGSTEGDWRGSSRKCASEIWEPA